MFWKHYQLLRHSTVQSWKHLQLFQSVSKFNEGYVNSSCMRSGPMGAELDPVNKLKQALYTAATLSEDVDFITRNFRAFMFKNLTDDSTVKCQLCIEQNQRFFTCYSCIDF